MWFDSREGFIQLGRLAYKLTGGNIQGFGVSLVTHHLPLRTLHDESNNGLNGRHNCVKGLHDVDVAILSNVNGKVFCL